ncbi:MAG: hypothetical protein LBC85_06890 [Fibromonadaceae bacterium]|jgi:hypothetical protein|nr:hypothetical protein [Fibromonadaceae bacterium]
MFRLFFLSTLCTVLLACSSADESTSLNEWLGSQGIASSYSKLFVEIIEVPIEINAGFNDSAFMVSTFAALGNVNGLEHTLYFGLLANESIEPTWNLRTDSIFYADFYRNANGEFTPLASRKIKAELCWLSEPDSSWFKLNKEEWEGCDEITFNWQAKAARDTFTISLPPKLLSAYPNPDSLSLLLGLQLLSNNEVLRIAPPSINDIKDLRTVAQRTRPLEVCETCLYATGARDSLLISLNMSNIDLNKTVVFAELILPKNDVGASEFEHPVPVYAALEEYRVDTAFVQQYGHPNLLFWGETDELKLQVTRGMRRHATSYVLRLGNPMLLPKTPSLNVSEKVFADRPDYAKYDFEALKEEKAKLRLWFADFGVE